MAVDMPTERSESELQNSVPATPSGVRTGRRRVTKGAIAAAGAVTAYAVPVATRVARGQALGSPPPVVATPTNPPLNITPTPTPPPGGQGCTPGFWKNNTQAWAGTGLTTTMTVEDLFNVDDTLGLDSVTLLAALDGGGGSELQEAAHILLRAGVAAALNAAHAGVNFPLTSAQVVSQVNTALATMNRDMILAAAASLDAMNNLGCPLSASVALA